MKLSKLVNGTLAATVMGFGALTLMAAKPVAAAPSSSSGAIFGSVDVQKVVAGYTKKATMDAQLQDLQGRLTAQMKQQANSPMLTKTQQTTLGALLSKPSPTDSDRAQITALQAQSNKDADELTALQQKKDMTDSDRSRLDFLTKEQQAGQQNLQDVESAYRDQLQSQNEKLSAQLNDTVKAAITAVAQQKGLAIVFDSAVAIYSANDITDDVVKRVNK